MQKIIFKIFLCLVSVAGFSACSDDNPDNNYTNVEMKVALPSGEQIVLLTPDNGNAGTFLRNVNNYFEYEIPVFVDNRATMRIEKGVYIMAFDGSATMADGTIRRVRMTAHSVMRDAIELTSDNESITLPLSFL